MKIAQYQDLNVRIVMKENFAFLTTQKSYIRDSTDFPGTFCQTLGVTVLT